ncbi:MAG: PAS domain S-box protein [Gammaproteobacteria bacterium]|nr:PAS domain S-box protein [Gammaproteobacteria bacterium]
MKPPVIPDNEAARLQALRDLAILDTAPEERFDRLTRLARQLFQVPIALISLVDEQRLWFKSRQGLNACETPRDISFCTYAIRSDNVFCIPNAQEDTRFADNPLVIGAPFIRMYAAYPLKTEEGFRIGTLCIIDTKPRKLTPQELDSLCDLGKCVEAEIKQTRLLQNAQTYDEQRAYLRAVLDTVKEGIISIDDKGIIRTVNPSTSAIFGYTPEDLIGQNVSILMPMEQGQKHGEYVENYHTSGKGGVIGVGLELVGRRKDGTTFPLDLEVQPMPQYDGKAHFVGVVRDIEQNKKTETSYHQARDRLDHFLSVTPGIIFACSSDDNYTTSFVSDNVIRIMGYRPAEFARDRKFWETHLHPEEKDRVLAQFETLKNENSLKLSFRMRHADGDYRWLNGSLHLLTSSDDTEQTIVGFLTDVTEQNDIQNEIAQSHLLLDAISRAQTQYIMETDIKAVSEVLLSDLLRISDSEYGFIGELHYTADGNPYLVTQAFINLGWDDDTRQEDSHDAHNSIELHDSITHFSEVLHSGESVIINPAAQENPALDDTAAHSFFGQPLYHGRKMIGMIGIANRPGGYPQRLVEFLQPLYRTCAQLIMASHNNDDRKRTVRELNRFKQTLDQTQDMIFIYNAETLHFEYLNDGAIQCMGYSRTELMRMRPQDIHYLITDKEFSALLQPLRDGEQKSLHFATQHRRKDGTEFPVEVFMQYINDKDSHSRFVSIVRDISERKRAEKESALYTAALEKLHNINTDRELDLAGRVHAILSLGCQVFGMSTSIVSRISNKEYRVEYAVSDANTPEPGTIFDLDDTYCARTIKLNRPIGYSHVAHSPMANEPGYKKFGLESYLGTPLYMGKELYGTLNFTNTDPHYEPFTARHYSLMRVFAQWIGQMLEEDRMIGELCNLTHLRQAILDSANFSIIATDTSGVIKSFSKGSQRMLGYLEDEVVGKLTPAIIHDPAEVAARAQVLSQELGYPVEPGFEAFVAKSRLEYVDENEWTYIRKDGSRFPVLLSVTALRDHERRITGYLGIASDITERKRVERMKNEFVSTVSHELRTPLTSIKGAIALVLSKSMKDLSPKAIAMLDTAIRNSERLTMLINDILDLEKIESGRMQFEFSPVDIVAAARFAVDANETYAQQHGVTLQLTTEINEAPVWGDNNRLQQIFANLLSNAIKFSEQDKIVSIRVSPSDTGVRVGIQDHGRGIPEEFRSRIFQRFAQADSSDTRVRGGTGLGLSITKAIVERLGGKINYRSETGVGTEFYFELPLLDETGMHTKNPSRQPKEIAS